VANKTYSLKNQKKLRLYLQKQENGINSQSTGSNNNKSRERTQADKKRLLR